MSPESKKNIQKLLARMEGQVRGLMNMVEQERDCVDVLTQVAAVRAALEAFGSLVLTEHIEQLVLPGTVPDEQLESLRCALERFVH